MIFGIRFLLIYKRSILYEPVVRVVEANVDGEANVVQGEEGKEAQTDYPRDGLVDYLIYKRNMLNLRISLLQ